MTRVVSVPQREHSCMIGHKWLVVTEEEAREQNAKHADAWGFPAAMAGTFLVDDLAVRDLPEGSVVVCEDCGKGWVKSFSGWRHSSGSVWCSEEWRPEKRRERKRRLASSSGSGETQ